MDTVVMNIKNQAISEYDGFSAINGIFNWAGKTLACSSGGLLELTGDDDNGTDIDCSVKFPKVDLCKDVTRRVRDIYLVKRGGLLTAHVKLDEGSSVDYNTIKVYNNIHEERIKLGKGHRGRYLEISFENVDGAPFDMDSIRAQVELILHRVR